jgi:hypothetical protein
VLILKIVRVTGMRCGGLRFYAGASKKEYTPEVTGKSRTGLDLF